MKINITLPCYNEEKILRNNLIKLLNFLKKNLTADEWQIVIADNLSTDQTAKIAKELSENYSQIKYLRLNQKGKGLAISEGWKKMPADIYVFMDADLATDLKALPKLIEPLKNRECFVVIGSRFNKNSRVKRTLLRKFISYGYNIVRKILINSKISDAPCGFKAVDNEIIKNVLPQVKDNRWFFDSELIFLAERNGYKIKEIPIEWEDIRETQDKSKVKIISLGLDYFKNLVKLRKRLKEINKRKYVPNHN